MAGRLVAVWVLLAALAGSVGLAGARLTAPLPLGLAAAGAVLAVVAGALAGRGRLRGTSPGARDNGSGVVAALAFAEASSDSTTGILITGAEEFGMVGARVFAQTGGVVRGVEVVNIDTIDGEGPLFVVRHDSAGKTLAEQVARDLAVGGTTGQPAPAAGRHSGGQSSAGQGRGEGGHGRPAHLADPAGDPHARGRAGNPVARGRESGGQSARRELTFRAGSHTFARGFRSPARGSFSLLWGAHVRRQDHLSGRRWGAVGRRGQRQAGGRAGGAGRPGRPLPGRRQCRPHRRDRRLPVHPPADPFRHPPQVGHLRSGQRRRPRAGDVLRRAGPARGAGHRYHRPDLRLRSGPPRPAVPQAARRRQ